MAYAEILRLSLNHEYYGAGSPPLSARLDGDSEKAGLMMRQSNNRILVIADDAVERPDQIHLTLASSSPEFFKITDGASWAARPEMSVPLGTDDIAFQPEDNPPNDAGQLFDPQVALLSIDLPQEGPRDLTLSFATVHSVWTYLVIGGDATAKFEIIDQAKEITFDDIGKQALPNESEARVFRSRQALPARNRPPQRFSLQRYEDHGPKVLIPVLPAAGTQFLPLSEPGVAARLQSNIYINL